MALNKGSLKNKIEAAFNECKEAGKDEKAAPDQIIADLSQAIADAVDEYIKSATIIIPGGQVVQVVTSPTGGPAVGKTSGVSPSAKIS
jgi:hypothetical protein